MSTESFDDFNSTEQMGLTSELKPFQFRDDPNDKEKTLDWLNSNFEILEHASRSRFITYRRHHALYKGIHWRFSDVRNSDRDIEYTERKPRHTVNFVKEMVDTKVSQMARFRANIALIPAHDEQSDINNVKGCKLLLDARSEEIDLEIIHQDADMIKYVYGIVFQFVLWNPDAGPLHPSYRKLNEMYGNDLPSKYKRKLKKTGPIHVGDVDVVNYGPDRVFPEINKRKWCDVNHFDYIEWVNIHQLKADYPHLEDEIQQNKRERYDFELMEISRPEDEVMVRHFYHKKTKYLPEGAHIIYTDDVILEMRNFPYDDGRLPFVWDGDGRIYGELWPRSFIGDIEQMQRYYNNIQSAQARDLGIGSAPKWVAPKGACKIHHYNNEFTLMEFRGAIAPKLVQGNPVSEQSFTVQDRLERKIAKHSKVYDITRGEVPQGVTANSALRFLDEQESQRNMTEEQRRKVRVLAVYRMMLYRMAQFYKESDERTVKKLGRNNEYIIKSVKKANFSMVADIRLQNSSALPDTKTGRISTIVDLNIATQKDPVFKKEEIIKMLDLGLDDAFKDEATVAVDSAKQILEMLIEGESVPEPEPYDNLLVYYSIFGKAVQTISFKMKTPGGIKERILQYLMTLELLMYDKATKNQAFLMELLQVKSYPVIFTLPEPLSMLLPQPVEPQSESGVDTKNIKSMNKTGEEQ